MRLLPLLALLLLFCGYCQCQKGADLTYVKDNYDKQETYIAMRDGRRLYTVIYTPKDRGHPYPFLMERTPYSAGPYGDTVYKRSLGPNPDLMHGQFIFVYQDVRGRYMSEGEFQEMTPHREGKKSPQETDEGSDTWDTVDWLLKNIGNNN